MHRVGDPSHINGLAALMFLASPEPAGQFFVAAASKSIPAARVSRKKHPTNHHADQEANEPADDRTVAAVPGFSLIAAEAACVETQAEGDGIHEKS